MRLLLDMNLSPRWLPLLREHGYEATHWSEVGDGGAPDHEIMQWAREHGCVIFTHDLDFGLLLAHTRVGGPSVIQARSKDVTPGRLGAVVLRALQVHGMALRAGALLTVSASKTRVRILPI